MSPQTLALCLGYDLNYTAGHHRIILAEALAPHILVAPNYWYWTGGVNNRTGEPLVEIDHGSRTVAGALLGLIDYKIDDIFHRLFYSLFTSHRLLHADGLSFDRTPPNHPRIVTPHHILVPRWLHNLSSLPDERGDSPLDLALAEIISRISEDIEQTPLLRQYPTCLYSHFKAIADEISKDHHDRKLQSTP